MYALKALFTPFEAARSYVAGLQEDAFMSLGTLEEAKLFSDLAELVQFVSRWGRNPVSVADSSPVPPDLRFTPWQPATMCGRYAIHRVTLVSKNSGYQVVDRYAIHRVTLVSKNSGYQVVEENAVAPRKAVWGVRGLVSELLYRLEGKEWSLSDQRHPPTIWPTPRALLSEVLRVGNGGFLLEPVALMPLIALVREDQGSIA